MQIHEALSANCWRTLTLTRHTKCIKLSIVSPARYPLPRTPKASIWYPCPARVYFSSTPSRISTPTPATPSKVVGGGTTHVPLPLAPANRPVPPVTWKL